MARRWKGIAAIRDNKDMIEHTISKYAEVTVHTSPVIHAARESIITSLYSISTKHRWTKEMCEKYINELRAKGYKEGVPLMTKWNVPGTLRSFMDIPEDGLEFFHQKYPNIFTITRQTGSNTVLYNEEEAQPIEGATNDCQAY